MLYVCYVYVFEVWFQWLFIVKSRATCKHCETMNHSNKYSKHNWDNASDKGNTWILEQIVTQIAEKRFPWFF